MSQENMFEKHGAKTMKQAEKLASLVGQKLIKEGIYQDVKSIKDDNGFDIVYKKDNEQYALVYIAIGSIEKMKGTLVDIGFDIDFYEEGEKEPIKKCLEAALKEYINGIGNGI